MKIFSLETKKHLVGWGLVLGVAINFFVFNLSYRDQSADGTFLIDPSVWVNVKQQIGWPFSVSRVICDPCYDIKPPFYTEPGYFRAYSLDTLFWIAISLIILSLVRHFRKKNQTFPPSRP